MAIDTGTLDTFPKLLMHHARVRPSRPAIREKDLGIWQTRSWHEFADEVRALACGLAAAGFQRGEHFALVSDNRPRLYAMMYAVQCLGGVPVVPEVNSRTATSWPLALPTSLSRSDASRPSAARPASRSCS